MELLTRVEPAHWLAIARVEKYHELDALPIDPVARRRFTPDEVLEMKGNVLVTGSTGATGSGVQSMWARLIGTTTSPAYDATNGRVGVGDGNGSVPTGANGDTDLTAPTNKLRKVVTGLATISGRGLTFVADFTSGEANFAWREWGVFNSNTAAQGMLNHKGEDLGTKTTGTWTLTVTLSIS